MSISKWLKMDLHIHSWKSNKNKKNDYKGDKYTVDKLISKLKEKEINIFSITDHNILNMDLYNQLLKEQENLIENNLNFVIGVELDIKDPEIYGDNEFHALLFFKTYNLDKIQVIINQLTAKEDKEIRPSISKIFDVMNDNGERNFILIPHFNNKYKGLKDNLMKRGPIDCLNTMVFDAYEDSNNIKNIQKSLDVYSKNGYHDLPMFIFSDCHNIDVYPKYQTESDKEPKFLNILGNLRYPFNSLKLSFQDSNLRIGYADLEENTNFRKAISKKDNKYYIKELQINGEKISLSEYQNTIIGGFGSGKSFLLKLLIEGKSKLKETHNKEYGELLNNIDSFKVIMSDGSQREALEETSNECEIILFEQNEGLFYKNLIDENEKEKLEKKLKIKFPSLEIINKMKFDNLNKAIERYKALKLEAITDSLKYEALEGREFYRIKKGNNFYKTEIKDKFEVDELLSQLEDEKNKQVFRKKIYSKAEQKQIEETVKLIQSKNNEWVNKTTKHKESLSNLDVIINNFNEKESNDATIIKSNTKIYEQIEQFIIDLGRSLSSIKKECTICEKKISKEEFVSYKNKESIDEYGDYKLITRYKCDIPYENHKDLILQSSYRENDLFHGIIETIRNKESFHNKKEFNYNIEGYFAKIFYKNFSEFNYDIKRENKSIMEKSAGEKANMILELIFSIIEKNINSNRNTILLIDQPEDHLDNKNIDSNIVRKIIEMKERNRLPQFIFVTHNSNVAITADSENIIIAQKEYNKCIYTNSGIEDEEFIQDVCKILEGGPEALKRRGMKFSVSYIKEYFKKGKKDEN